MTKANLKDHKEWHEINDNGLKYSCDICDTSFAHKSSFITHVKRKHDGSSSDATPNLVLNSFQKSKNFRCHLCEQAFTMQSNLNRHIRKFHRNDK